VVTADHAYAALKERLGVRLLSAHHSQRRPDGGRRAVDSAPASRPWDVASVLAHLADAGSAPHRGGETACVSSVVLKKKSGLGGCDGSWRRLCAHLRIIPRTSCSTSPRPNEMSPASLVAGHFDSGIPPRVSSSSAT